MATKERQQRQQPQTQRTRYRVSGKGASISDEQGGTVSFAAPQFSPPDVTGAPGAVFVLGAGLAGVALWNGTIRPIVGSAWTGEKLNITLPAPQVLGIVLFVGVLVFLSDLSGDLAQLALWLILAMWAVYLIMNPGTVSGALGLLSGQSGAQSQQQPQSNANNGGSTNGSGSGSRTVK